MMQSPLPLLDYDRVIVAWSGGKDSLACLLHLLSIGVPDSKIELWHHCVDGYNAPEVGEVERPLFDWACTVSYCKAVGKIFKIPVYLSWRSGGFEREALRENKATAPCYFQTPNGLKKAGGNSRKLGTRRRFPQLSDDLSVRWCSSSLKIDVCAIALRNDPRFEGKKAKTLFVSGERAEESPNRAKYPQVEIHRADPRKSRKSSSKGRVNRHIDHWRPILNWREVQVWNIIRKFRVNPHPAYRLGWSRVSCMLCIFGSPAMFASANKIAPGRTAKIGQYEKEFDSTVKPPDRNGNRETILELASKAKPFAMKQSDIKAALSTEWYEPIILPKEAWTLPAGAFGENAGPS